MEERGSGGSEASGYSPDAIRVRMFGGFLVSVGSRTIEEREWRLRKASSLVKLLALEPGRQMHREQVLDRLWPELDEKAAANNLRQALHVARRVLEPAPTNGPDASGHLRFRGERLALRPETALWTDVEAFEEAATAARRSREPAAYRAAAELYAGELLPDDRYEGWVEDRREGLRKLYLDLLVELAGLHEERDEFGPAIEALERVVVKEPAHEAAHTGLMRLYAFSGRREEALGQYEKLREALAAELGDEPGAISRRLHEEITAGEWEPSRPPEEPQEPLALRQGSRHNLPHTRSSFVGREHELIEVKRELAMTRLLTLAGAGGSGKTRLALKVAGNLVETYPDGVWLIELAPLSEEALVPQAVASALGVREQPGRPLTETLADHLRNSNTLLVLDNCEHVVDVAARLTDTLLDACPRVRILATSREALRTGGEVVWRVPSLSVPDPGDSVPVEELARSEAVRLFVERARSRGPGFELAERNARAVGEICRRLDGIPLAIELAAARAGVLSPEQIAERLDDSLGLLRGGGRTALPRHQTLRGALAWSYELLSEAEKKLFGRLSVFAGGWTLEAAEAVGSVEGTEDDVLDLLELLVDKSLVLAGGSDPVRYRLLEPVRQYARERLEESTEEAAETHRRHALWYLELAERAEEELTGPAHQAWLDRLETEHDNLRAALGWALGAATGARMAPVLAAPPGEAELGLRLAAALWLFWYTHGHLAEGRDWLEKALVATVQP